jgi:hypothetical protein
MSAIRATGVRESVLAVLLWLALAAAARADDPCAGFSWDVRHERELFGQVPQSLSAASTPATAPALTADRLYELKLVKESQVSFASAPGGTHSAAGTYAGLARLSVPSAGLWRISLDGKFWVDVLAQGTPTRSQDFQGRPGCDAPHKIVEFTLPAGTPLMLQFSGGSSDTLKIAVTRSPTRAP